jgi:ectoine hydroxylase-related dioxygenase (phytanoyl-CoA dioxygenase family)
MSRSFQVAVDGFRTIRTHLDPDVLTGLRDSLFVNSRAGERCLLDHPLVRETAMELKAELIASGDLEPEAVAIQAIAFDKSTAANWKVAWHQDLMFPFARQITSAGFELPCIKEGVHYARPPATVLDRLLAVRLHLDDCDESNGPLRVSPRTHLQGILKTSDIPEMLAANGEFTCLANQGEALLMRPLLLHASSQATKPQHRRVLHLVYHSGDAITETWHRAV